MEDNKRKTTSGQKAAEDTMENTIPSIENLLRDVEDEASLPAMDSKALDRMINRRIAAIVTRVLLVIAVCIGLLLCIIHPVMKLATYNYKAKANAVKEETGENELARYLKAYSSVFTPYLEIYDAEVKDRGFGRYAMTMYITDHREKFIAGAAENQDLFHVFDQWWSCKEQSDQRFVHVIGRFAGTAPEEIVPELEELPESAVIYCNVTLSKAILPEDLWQDGIEVLWLRVDQAVSELDAGIRIRQRVGTSVGLEGRTGMTGAQLQQIFVNDLDLLLSDTELLKPLGIPFSTEEEDGTVRGGVYGSIGISNGLRELQELRDMAEGWQTIRTKQICLSGKKADILAFIESMEVQNIRVEDVWMSQWSK